MSLQKNMCTSQMNPALQFAKMAMLNLIKSRKPALILSLFFFLYAVKASAVDTLHVVTHDRTTVVTNPSQGYNVYKAWGKFPSTDEPIRQIKLKLQLGCPDSMRCADWDYKDHITIRRKGGVNGASLDYEIGRMLTPYGGAFASDWKFNWEVDITDFSLFLRDSVEIEYNHTGYEPNNDRGWSVTLDFEIIKGKPAIEPVSIQKIYDGSFRYGDSSNSIENALKPVAFATAKDAQFARLRVVQTGHGMDKPDNCAEFCSKYREIWYDEKLIDKRDIWKACGENPLYPQAGTWVYDRAAWCPGDLMPPDIYDLAVKTGGQHIIDINMQPYVSTAPSADEYITAYLIQYKRTSATTDIRVDDIIAPSSHDRYRRHNPASMNPQILVKNLGTSTINRFRVQYGTKGFSKKVLNWSGHLSPSTSVSISLPSIIESREGQNHFEVELLQPNGRKDNYPKDNKSVVSFEAAPKHDSTIIVYLQTNNQPAHNSYVIKNSEGVTVQERSLGFLQANTLYMDTVRLSKGHYLFVLSDTAGNGLEFWANPRGGRGKARLLNKDGSMLKDFESDFGSSARYAFEVGTPVAAITPQTSVGLYPTRTDGKTTLDYYSNFAENVLVQIITDPGDQVVEEHIYHQIKQGVFTYDLSRFPKGRFYLKVLVEGKEIFKKRIRLKE
jgi:hypothetical protein